MLVKGGLGRMGKYMLWPLSKLILNSNKDMA